jgi:hypothetical protein
MLTIPDEDEATWPDQSTLFQETLDVLLAGIRGLDFVVSGCAVTGGASMTPAVAKGAVISNGTLWPVTAATVTVSAAHASLDRIDLIVVDTAGAKQVRAGTPATNPKPAARTANDVVLALVYVAATVSTIPTTALTDQRVYKDRDVTLKRTTTAVTHNTTTSIFPYFTVTLPSGLFLTGRQLLVRCGGDYLINSGTPTLTLQIDFGGTTMFADATAAFTADSDRGAWEVDLVLNASADAVQQLSGRAALSTPGAKTGAATGEGDLAVATAILGPFYGAATVDCDAGDRTLDVQWTMSVSNAADEIVCAYGYARLL